MPCSDYSEYGDFMTNGQFFDAIYCPFADQMGVALAGLIFFGAIGLSLYIYTDSIAVPLSVAVVVGAAFMTTVPAIAVNIVMIAGLLGITVAGFFLVMRLKPN